jgi:predicted lipoprotein with Yx(FWY)xxD motif
VVPEKRKLMVGGAALAAAFALAGCAPAGYNAGGYGGGSAAQPAANAEDASPSADADAPGDAAGDDAPAQDAAPTLSSKQTTDDLTAVSVARMGSTVQDEGGWVLYRFDDDVAKPTSKSNCEDPCDKTWPPALTNNGKPKLKGVDPEVVGTVTRADGTKQLTIKGWPLYRYVGDKKPGTWKGQNVGGKWFVIKPNGTKNLTCLPKISKPVAPPKDDSNSDDAGSDDSGSAGGDYSY